MTRTDLLQVMRSWGKQEARALAPWQRRWLRRTSVVLVLGLSALALQRHHAEKRDQRDTTLQQATELATAQWSTLRATAYDWAHWDETHAFARGEAPGYPARNLSAANGLSSVAPVVLILNRSGALLTLQGRQGPSNWAQDPLARCSRGLASPLLSKPQTRGIHCLDRADDRVWIGVIEPITDTREREPVSGLMVLLAPLRHPTHGPTLQALMRQLERQVVAGAPGARTIRLQGQPLWGTDRQVLNLNPEPVIARSAWALGEDLSMALPFVVSLLGLRAALMLQRRRELLLQRRQEQRSQQRLRNARRQLEQLFAGLPHQERERALRRLMVAPTDPIDDLARNLELYASALRQQPGNLSSSPQPLFEPMQDLNGHLKRLQVLGGAETATTAVQVWSSLPSNVRCSLGLQFELTAQQHLDPQVIQALGAALRRHNMPHDLCTIMISSANLDHANSSDILQQLHQAGFRLGLIHNNERTDPGELLRLLPFDELQLSQPRLLNPTLAPTQQALLTALVHLGKVRGLQINIAGVQNNAQRAALQQLDVDLLLGELIGPPVEDPADLWLEGRLES